MKMLIMLILIAVVSGRRISEQLENDLMFDQGNKLVFHLTLH